MTGREKGLIGLTVVVGVVVGGMLLGFDPKSLTKFDFNFGGSKPPSARDPGQQLDLAVKLLESRVLADRRKAVTFLTVNAPTAEKPPDPEKQKAVVERLRKARADEDRKLRQEATVAYCRWAGPPETAELLKMATDDTESGGAKPAEAAAPLASLLARGEASEPVLLILKDLGPPAEPFVLPLIFEPVPPGKLTPEEQAKTTRQLARDLLTAYGTDHAKWVAQAVETAKAADVSFADPDKKQAAHLRRLAALDWLADQKPDPARPEVNAVFLKSLRHKDEKVRQLAFQGIYKWLQPGDYDALHRLLDVEEDTLRHRIIEMIGRLKNEKSEDVLIRRLANPKDRAAAGKALEGFGPNIEPKLLGVLLESMNDAEQAEACRLLGEVAVRKKTLDQLELFAKIHTVKLIQSACADAAAKIRKRMKEAAPG